MVLGAEVNDFVIVVRLTGGLGNQMFQYAAGRTLADRLNVPLKVDISDFETYLLRRYEIHDFAIRAGIADDTDLARFRVQKNRFTLWQRILRKTNLPRHDSFFSEKSFAYDDRMEKFHSPVYLDWFWQANDIF